VLILSELIAGRRRQQLGQPSPLEALEARLSGDLPV
jgi:hypothetical protein